MDEPIDKTGDGWKASEPEDDEVGMIGIALGGFGEAFAAMVGMKIVHEIVPIMVEAQAEVLLIRGGYTDRGDDSDRLMLMRLRGRIDVCIEIGVKLTGRDEREIAKMTYDVAKRFVDEYGENAVKALRMRRNENMSDDEIKAALDNLAQG